jgi:phospholipid/cholesterol/gamma-HCH transport system ATP-binding protein
LTIIIVTHDLATLFAVCERVAVLVGGKITIGTVDELMHSKQPWIHEFLHGPRAQGALTARKRSHGNG